MIGTLVIVSLISLSSVVHGFQCPADGHFANPDDRHSFYQCDQGIPYLMQCVAGLVWNQQLQVCDWDIVQPTSTSTSTTMSTSTSTTVSTSVPTCTVNNHMNCRRTSQWSTKTITIVGSDMQFGSDEYHVGSPFGIHVDSDRGYVYVAETENNRVQRFHIKAPGTSGTTVAGGNGAGNASNQLDWPSAVYVDQNENVYISDTDNYRIQMWPKDATSGITVAGGNGKGKALNQIGVCQSVFVHEKTNSLYISDFYNDRVVKWVPERNEGVIVAGNGIGGSGANQLEGPRGIYVDDCETIYVADLWNNRVQKWKKNATEGITVAGGNGQGKADNQLDSPWDVEVDQYENVYVVDTNNNRIMKWTSGATTGESVAAGTTVGNRTGSFPNTYGIGMSKEGNLFISDKRSHRVQQLNILPETNIC